MIKAYILLISQARRDNVLWNLVRIILDDWNSGESGAEKPRGGDRANKDHYWRDSEEGPGVRH